MKDEIFPGHEVIKEEYSNLSDEEFKKISEWNFLVDFSQRLWYSLDDIDEVKEETKKTIASLLWNNLFSIFSFSRQCLYSYDKFNKAYNEDKWEYISIHNFECVKELIEVDKIVWNKEDENFKSNLEKVHKLFNKIIGEDYYR